MRWAVSAMTPTIARIAARRRGRLLVTPYFNGTDGDPGGAPRSRRRCLRRGQRRGRQLHHRGPWTADAGGRLPSGGRSSAIDPGRGVAPIASSAATRRSLPTLTAIRARSTDGGRRGQLLCRPRRRRSTEVVSATAAPPEFVSTPPGPLVAGWFATLAVPYIYQVVAVDPNGTAVGYTVASCTRNLILHCAPDADDQPHGAAELGHRRRQVSTRSRSGRSARPTPQVTLPTRP